MKIKEIQAVNIKLPPVKPKTPARRQSWRQYAPIALPMSRYFPPDMPRRAACRPHRLH